MVKHAFRIQQINEIKRARCTIRNWAKKRPAFLLIELFRIRSAGGGSTTGPTTIAILPHHALVQGVRRIVSQPTKFPVDMLFRR